MSFFDNPKNAGLALIIVAILNLIGAIIAIYEGATGEFSLGAVLAGVGAVIVAILYFGYGKKIRSGSGSKVEILAGFVMVVGIGTIIAGIFGLVQSISGGIVSIIVGLIIIFCAKKINDGKTTTIDKIIWILLLIAFILGIIGGLLELLAFPIGTIMGICDIILYVFMLLLLIDPEVKDAMGM